MMGAGNKDRSQYPATHTRKRVCTNHLLYPTLEGFSQEEAFMCANCIVEGGDKPLIKREGLMSSSLCFGTVTFSLDVHFPNKPLHSSSPSSSSLSPQNPSLDCLTDNKSSSSKGSKRKVSVFWDLDNKPPQSSPYHAALHLRRLAAQFGDVADMVACANRHAFLHIPRWVQEGRSFANPTDLKQTLHPSSSLSCMCAFCSFACATPAELKKHCRLSHRREWRNMGSKGYPNGGYGLHMELFRAGFCVRTVDHSPQAADRALKRQIKHSMDNGVHCICLVSDDSDFAEILKTARSKRALTVVIGDTPSLQQFADFWFPWNDVARGNDTTGTCIQDYKDSQICVENESNDGVFLSREVVEASEDADVLSQEMYVPDNDNGENHAVWVFEGD